MLTKQVTNPIINVSTNIDKLDIDLTYLVKLEWRNTLLQQI